MSDVEVKKKLDKISSSFCSLPWIHSTIHLYLGKTHSCHHCPPHDIDINKIKNNPSFLHNTIQKKQIRRDALNNIQSPDCDYCWNLENNQQVSDRLLKNGDPYVPSNFDHFNDYSNINPRYIEISFSNKCNFKCGYCYPQVSSMWEKDISYYGNFNISNINKQHYSIDFLENNNFYRSEDNPYIQTFWKWFPDIIQELQILRITGGEPLLHSSTFLLLDKIDTYPNPKLTISINSNLGVTNRRIQDLCQRMRKLKIDKKIKRFRLFTSIDTWGPKAEYIRTGLDLSLWEKNLCTIMDAGFEVMLMCTYNALSVSSFTSLLKKIVEWRSKFGFDAIRFDAPYLRNPLFWNICILPSDFENYIYQSIQFIIDNQSKFRDDEFTRVDRLLAYKKMNSFTEPNLAVYKQDFYNFFSVMDQRNNTDFCSVFPEYINFYNSTRIAI